MKVKVVGRSPGTADAVAEARILLQTVLRLRGPRLVPRGVYRFATHEEADRWMTTQMANTHAHHASKTSPGSASP